MLDSIGLTSRAKKTTQGQDTPITEIVDIFSCNQEPLLNNLRWHINDLKKLLGIDFDHPHGERFTDLFWNTCEDIRYYMRHNKAIAQRLYDSLHHLVAIAKQLSSQEKEYFLQAVIETVALKKTNEPSVLDEKTIWLNIFIEKLKVSLSKYFTP